jgi:hypothetical protein
MAEFGKLGGGNTMEITLCDDRRGSTIAREIEPMAVGGFSVLLYRDEEVDEVGPEMGVHRCELVVGDLCLLMDGAGLFTCRANTSGHQRRR